MSILDFKQSNNARYGFTIAEILLTLAIVGTIAALGIPMLGQQKMKKPEQLKLTQKHGTFECFYGNENAIAQGWGAAAYAKTAGGAGMQGARIHSYYADNTEFPDGVIDQHIVGDQCQFTPPDGAENFIVYAIGAGGVGAAGMDSGAHPYYTPESVDANGTIQTGHAFKTSLAAAIEKCPWIETYWDRQWERGASPIKYTLKSPLGSGGYDDQEPTRRHFEAGSVAGEECIKNCTIIDENHCDATCIDIIKAKGGYGGYGGKLVASVKLRLYDDVVYETSSEHTKLQFNGSKYILLKPSEQGENGVIWHDIYQNLRVRDGRNGDGYDRFGSIQSVLNNGYAEKGNSSDMTLSSLGITERREPYSYDALNKIRDIKAGSISVYPTSIMYRSVSAGINAYFGLAGTAGSTSLRVYEKLPTGTAFKLTPALSTYMDSVVDVKINNQWAQLFSASSGSDGNAHNEILPIDDGDRIFPRKYEADDFTAKVPAFSVSHGVGYSSLLARHPELMPGKSGAGAYPVLAYVGKSKGLYWLSGIPVGNGTVEEINYPAPYVCFDGTAAISNGSNYYCGQGDSVGNPGAIVIKW